MPNYSGRPLAARGRRIAACTALALSAGMLLSAPAAADDTVPPRAGIEQVRPGPSQQPTLTLPERGERSERFAAGAEGAVDGAKPRTDIDNDGFSDLFYRANNGKLYVLASAAGDEHEYTINGDQGELSKDIIAPGDLDGGGGPEFLTLSASGKLSLFQSWGDTNTGYVTWSGTGWQAYNKVFAPGDLNGDGRGDVLARTPAGELYLYVSNGAVDSNPFRTRIKVGTGWGQFDQLSGANDVNGDGFGDVFARTTGGDLYFYAGTGNTASPLKSRVKVGTGWGQYNQIVGVDDQDGDGLGDVIARTPAGQLYSYESNGSGNFLAKQTAGSGWHGAALFVGAGSNPHFGKSEVIGLTTGGTLFYYYGLNNGLLSTRQQISDTGGWSGAKPVFASSLDDWGWGDLLEVYDNKLYNYSHEHGVYTIGSGWAQYNTIVGPGDLNGDGKGDLLTRTPGGTLYLQRGNGEGSAFASRINVGSGWGQYNKLVGAGDLTGDGRADLLARTPGGTLYLYAGTGNSSAAFKARTKIGTGWNQYTKLAAPGDINGDGRADLLAANSAGELFRYHAKGTGQFATKAKVGNGWGTYRDLY
ncbi:VCBS repeat-containing protein [Streptomyces flavidovirens]|uniref:FG-GAP repeat domain-containing protein n=1 Tax=Streptomyces flavidovirens TaxID=67298 RepID=UPI0033A0AD1E